MTKARWDAETVPEADLQARQRQVLLLLPEQGSILEVGSGEGRTLCLLGKGGRLLVGVDISLRLLYKAREKGDGFENVQADAQNLPLASNTFDTVLAQEVLEHVFDWQAALEELFRTARERLIVMVPYREWLKGRQCPHCEEWVPLYGHFHRFARETFAPWRERGRMNVKMVGPPMGWRAYGQKAATWLRRNPRGEEEELMLRCPGCGRFLAQGLRWQRAVDRLWRLLTRKPEWLLVVWEIGEE